MSMLIFPFFSHKTPPEILKEPDRKLRVASEKIDKFGGETEKIAKKLISVTQKVDKPWKIFLGMAAPQIGYNKRIVILRKSFGKYDTYINPEIIERKWFIPAPTACYSVKGIYITITPLYMKVRFQDLKGNLKEETLIGGLSGTMQQEIDHIDGRLISD